MTGDIITYTALRENHAKVMDEVCDSAAPVIITRQNKRPVVMISCEEFRGIEETLHLLSSPANAERLRRSIEQANAGNLEEHELYEPADLDSKSAA